MNRQTCILITCPSITISTIEVILRKRNAKKLEANEKLKSGIFCVLESGICIGRIHNPAPRIRNPQHGIQNLILSWITLHGEMFYTQHQHAYYPYCSPYVYKGVDKEKLLQNQEPLWLEIVFFILVTSLFDSGVKL